MNTQRCLPELFTFEGWEWYVIRICILVDPRLNIWICFMCGECSFSSPTDLEVPAFDVLVSGAVMGLIVFCAKMPCVFQ